MYKFSNYNRKHKTAAIQNLFSDLNFNLTSYRSQQNKINGLINHKIGQWELIPINF